MRHTTRALFWAMFGLVSLAPHSATTTQAQSIIYNETFDGVTAPALPPGIQVDGEGWETSTATSSTGSGENSLSHSGSTDGTATLGPLDFSAVTSAQLSYLARRTGTYPVDSLQISASVDGGAFETVILGMGGALPVGDGSWVSFETALPELLEGQSEVRLRFEAWGGTSGSSSIRLDDIGISAELDPSAIPSEFGFGQPGSAVAPPDTSASLGVDLSWPGPDAIQGLQFDLSWEGEELAFLGLEPGSAVGPGTGWTLEVQPLSTSARVVLLGHEGAALDPGVYSGLMSVRFEALTFDSPDPQPTSSDVTISGAIFAAATPEGDDIPITGGARTHTISAMPSSPEISVAPDTLRFGQVPVGDSAALTVTISNDAESGDLHLSDIAASPSEFAPDLTEGTVAAGSGLDLEIVFTPSPTQFGLIEGELSLTHDAGGEPVVIVLEGIGTGGRGDADGDGAVDVADVLAGIDVVLGVQPVTPEIVERADVHPFPAGNGDIDVRDLTVQVQAVLADAWPDAIALPTPAPIEEAPAAGKGAHVLVRVEQSGSGANLILDSPQSLRGVQLVLQNNAESAFHAISGPLLADDPLAGSIAQTYRMPGSGISRILIARPPGKMIGAGKTQLIELSLNSDIGELIYGVAVTDDGQKLAVLFDDTGSTTAEPSPELPASHDLALSVFPNPLRLGVHAGLSLLVLPLSSPGQMVQLELVDVTGRVRFSTRKQLNARMRLDLKAQSLESGLYFARVRGEGISEAASVVVVR